jgi:hypothetical protein
MGRRSYSNRLFADGLNKISVSDLKKSGYLVGFKKGVVGWEDKYGEDYGQIGLIVTITEEGGYVRLLYKNTDFNGMQERVDYKVDLTTTRCYYGGSRYWFICPLIRANRYCGRRVGKIYAAGKYFGCRYCHDLTYKSRQRNKRSRFYVSDKSWNLEEKLEKTWMSLKRSYYAAKPTRTQRKLWELESILGYDSLVSFHGLSIRP